MVAAKTGILSGRFFKKWTFFKNFEINRIFILLFLFEVFRINSFKLKFIISYAGYFSKKWTFFVKMWTDRTFYSCSAALAIIKKIHIHYMRGWINFDKIY